MAPVAEVPSWLLRALGTGISDVHRLPWGFTNETWVATDVHGARRVATLMASPTTAAVLLHRAPRLVVMLGAVGLETPVPIHERSDPERGVVVAAWLDGIPGMLKLAVPDGARAIGIAAGEAWRRLGGVDPAGAELQDLWAQPAALADAATTWLHMASTDMAAALVAAAGRRLDGLAAASAPARFVHGDLVPANLLYRDGRPPVILDLETVRVGDPLFDAAWFSWIVRYHHPPAWPAAWAGFVEAAGLSRPDDAPGALMLALPTARILEILANPALTSASRSAWLAQLEAILALVDVG